MKEPPQRRAEETEEKGEGEKAVPIWDCGSPLYDSFELASLCHLLDRHQMTLPFSKESARLGGRVFDEPDAMPREQKLVVGWRGTKEKTTKRRKVGLLRSMFSTIGFWRRIRRGTRSLFWRATLLYMYATFWSLSILVLSYTFNTSCLWWYGLKIKLHRWDHHRCVCHELLNSFEACI